MLKKIILGLGILIGVIVVGIILAGVIIISYNNSEKGGKEEILKSISANPEKALVIYQPSRSSISSDVAHNIAKGLNDSGYEVTMNHPGKDLSYDLSQYSTIVFGTPTIAGTPSKALTDYMSRINDFSNKRIALYSTGQMQTSDELGKLEGLVAGGKVYKKAKFILGGKTDNNKAAYEFGKELAK